VWRFDEAGALSRPDPEEPHEPKWTYRDGISRLGKLLARYSHADIQTRTRVEKLEHRDQQWVVRSQQGGTFAPFDAVVLTPPAPQTASILADSEGGGARVDRIERAVEEVHYAPQFSFVFAFDRSLSRPGNFYGLRATKEASHPLKWIGFEHDKPGHVKSGHSMVVVQTAPDWTAPRVDREPDTFVPEVKEWTEDVLVADLRRPEWYDVQRWRYAYPTAALEGEMVSAGAELGLILAGDYVPGVGRVSRAIETGFAAAQQVRTLLDVR